jgi:hypothetical protein
VGPRVSLDSRKSRPTGIRSPDRPAPSQSLYRLSYRAHNVGGYYLEMIQWDNTAIKYELLLPEMKTKKKYCINLYKNIYTNGRILEEAITKYIVVTV